jgi:hypothetical protein
MTENLGAQTAFSFDIDTTFEVVTTDGQKLAIASSGTVAVARPDRIRVTRIGGFSGVEIGFDGTAITVLATPSDSFARAPVTGSVGDAIAALRDRYGAMLPVADLLEEDAYGAMMADVTEARDLGSGVIAGIECDHVAFRTPEVDWQVWITQGEAPRPCRLVVTTKGVEGWPQYTVDIRNWKTGAEASADLAVAIPAGARELDPAAMKEAGDVTGIYSLQGAR